MGLSSAASAFFPKAIRRAHESPSQDHPVIDGTDRNKDVVAASPYPGSISNPGGGRAVTGTPAVQSRVENTIKGDRNGAKGD